MKNMEQWLVVGGYDNYMISSLGRVKSLNYHNSGVERILKPSVGTNGYLSVVLSNCGKTKRVMIHRLVAEAFVPNPENKPCVDHINTKRNDNRAKNLRWCSLKENAENPKTKNNMCLAQKKNGDKFKKKVRCVETGEVYFGIKDTAQKIGVYPATLSGCLGNNIKTVKGYHWELV